MRLDDLILRRCKYRRAGDPAVILYTNTRAGILTILLQAGKAIHFYVLLAIRMYYLFIPCDSNKFH